MLLSSSAGQRGYLESQIRLVHDVTGKPLNEIRTDLEYTGDAQKTIERICDGEFLKGTLRDPSSKAQPNNNLMAPKFPSLSAAKDGAERKQKLKGKDTAKTAPQALEVIDLCDSDDHSPPPTVRFKRPSTFKSSEVWKGAIAAKSNAARSSTSSSSTITGSIKKSYTSNAAVRKTITEKPPTSSPPLFRYTSSSSPSPSTATGSFSSVIKSYTNGPAISKTITEEPPRQASVPLFRYASSSSPPPSATTDSFSSVIKPCNNSTAIPKTITEEPPRQPSVPLFRYAPSSSLSPPPVSPPQPSPANKRPKAPTTPMKFHSPATSIAVTPKSNKRQKIVHVIEIDDDSDSDVPPPIPRQPRLVASPIVKKASTNLSAATRALLEEFSRFSEDSDSGGRNKPNNKRRASNTTPRKATATRAAKVTPGKRKTKAPSAEIPDLNEEESAQDSFTEQPTKKGNRLPEAEKARRVAEKEEAKLQRQREREAKVAEKEEAKAQKQREKEAKDLEKKIEQELLSVNKLKTSKKDSAPEMIVDISQHLKDAPIGEQLQRFLVGLGCEVNPTWYPAVGEGAWRVIKWRRKVKAEYNEERGMFVPLPEMKVTDECHVLAYITAKEFLDISMNCDGSGLAMHVSRLRQFSPRHAKEVKLIYLIEGLDALIRKNRNNRNRAYQNRVRAALGADEGKAADAELIDEDEIQDSLLRLQVIHGCLIYHTTKEMETAEWITKFTGDISSIPYKKSRQLDMAFCTDVGQVKTGVGKADTYTRMLEEINRVTPSVANGIASEYPDVMALVKGFERYGENALADLPIISTTDGQPMNRNIGAACSKRIYAVFMDKDPDGTEL